jgi:hypothetical protein
MILFIYLLLSKLYFFVKLVMLTDISATPAQPAPATAAPKDQAAAELIEELKLSRAVGGIKKLKEERAKDELKRQEEVAKELNKQFTADNFVDKVILDIEEVSFTMYYYLQSRSVFISYRFLIMMPRATQSLTGRGRCLPEKQQRKQRRKPRNRGRGKKSKGGYRRSLLGRGSFFKRTET